VVELRRGAGLAQQAGVAAALQAGIAQYFDGDSAIEQGVVRAIDDAPPVVAELGVEAIAILERGANHT